MQTFLTSSDHYCSLVSHILPEYYWSSPKNRRQYLDGLIEGDGQDLGKLYSIGLPTLLRTKGTYPHPPKAYTYSHLQGEASHIHTGGACRWR